MGKRPGKEQSKGRLDKYYHAAKLHGYRARSAWKIVQMNERFNFFQDAKIVFDLCAAPGSWMQVARRHVTSKKAQIVGVDLKPITSITGCATLVGDITSKKTFNALRHGWKFYKNEYTGAEPGTVDVVLCDAAPDVGGEMTVETFIQNSVVLKAFECACKFLRHGGTFVTKVFRSKDTMSLLFALRQLFDEVLEFKPKASREVSSEFFAVCRGFKSPKSIDSRFFDPAHVFKQDHDSVGEEFRVKKMVSDSARPTNISPVSAASSTGKSLSTMLQERDKTKKRGGYSTGDTFRKVPVIDFFSAQNDDEILARAHLLEWTSTDPEKLTAEEKEIWNHPSTTQDIHDIMNDLASHGTKELTRLKKWRHSIHNKKYMKQKSERSIASRASQKEDVASMRTLIDFESETQRTDRLIEETEVRKVLLDEALAKQKRVESRDEKKRRRNEKRRLAAMNRGNGAFDADQTDESIFTNGAVAYRAFREAERTMAGGGTAEELSDSAETAEAAAKGITASQYLVLKAHGMEKIGDVLREETDLTAIVPTLAMVAPEDRDLFLDSTTKTAVRLTEIHRQRREASEAAHVARKKPRRRELVLREKQREFEEFALRKAVEAEKERLDDSDLSDDEERQVIQLRYDRKVAQLEVLVEQQEEDRRLRELEEASSDNEQTPDDPSIVGVVPLKTQPEAKKLSGWDAEVLNLIANDEEQERDKRKVKFSELHYDKELEERDNQRVIQLLPMSDKHKMQKLRRKKLKRQELQDQRKKRAEDRLLGALGGAIDDDLKPTGVRFQKAVPIEVVGMPASTIEDARPTWNDDDDVDLDPPSDPDEIAELQAMGKKLNASHSDRMQVIDSGFNRYANNDQQYAPTWLVEEEDVHCRSQTPVTKKEVADLRAKIKELNDRPIRKVMEARARSKLRLRVKLAKVAKQAHQIAGQDLTEGQKSKEIQKAINKAKAGTGQREKKYLTASRSGSRLLGKSVKSKTSQQCFVDKRMKADKRAVKALRKRGIKERPKTATNKRSMKR